MGSVNRWAAAFAAAAVLGVPAQNLYTYEGADRMDKLVAAAKKAGKLLMVAHVLPFFPEFKYAAEAVRSKRYGKVVAAHFKRVIAKPDWSADIGDAAMRRISSA